MPVEQSLYAFVKAGIILDNHALSLKAQNERDFTPVIKHIPIDILFEVI